MTYIIVFVIFFGAFVAAYYGLRELNFANETLARILLNVFAPLTVILTLVITNVLFVSSTDKKLNAALWVIFTLGCLAGFAYNIYLFARETRKEVLYSFTNNMYIATGILALLAFNTSFAILKLLHSRNFVTAPFRILKDKYKKSLKENDRLKSELDECKEYFKNREDFLKLNEKQNQEFMEISVLKQRMEENNNA